MKFLIPYPIRYRTWQSFDSHPMHLNFFLHHLTCHMSASNLEDLLILSCWTDFWLFLAKCPTSYFTSILSWRFLLIPILFDGFLAFLAFYPNWHIFTSNLTVPVPGEFINPSLSGGFFAFLASYHLTSNLTWWIYLSYLTWRILLFAGCFATIYLEDFTSNPTWRIF